MLRREAFMTKLSANKALCLYNLMIHIKKHSGEPTKDKQTQCQRRTVGLTTAGGFFNSENIDCKSDV